MGRIYAHFALRRSSLRQWAADWAARQPQTRGVSAERAYASLKVTLGRWTGRDGHPRAGTLGYALWCALSREVGADVLPLPPARLPAPGRAA